MSSTHELGNEKLIRKFAVKCGIPILIVFALCVIGAFFQDAAKEVFFAVGHVIGFCLGAVAVGIFWLVKLINYGEYLSTSFGYVIDLLIGLPLLVVISIVLVHLWLLCIRHKLKKQGLVDFRLDKSCIASFMVSATVLIFGAYLRGRTELELIVFSITFFVYLFVHIILAILHVESKCDEQMAKSPAEGKKDD